MLAVLVLTAFGCPGSETRRDRGIGDGRVLDVGQSGEGGDTCSATGAAASCDPVAPGGCAAGACYVLKGKGTSCVCPAGAGAIGAACNTTVECAPGHVCAGTQAPGVCRKTCYPATAQCPASNKCTFITEFPTLGYCEPS